MGAGWMEGTQRGEGDAGNWPGETRPILWGSGCRVGLVGDRRPGLLISVQGRWARILDSANTANITIE